MHRVLALVLTIALVEGQDHKKCIRLYVGTSRCCKDILSQEAKYNDDVKECFDIPRNPHSCDYDICIGKKRGFASADGTINMDELEKLITEDFQSNPLLLESIKKKCFQSDFSHYGPPDACQLTKLNICIHMAIIRDCKDWDDNGSCSGMKDLAEECSKMAAEASAKRAN